MLAVYGFPNSRSLRAVWALEEAGAQYTYHKIELMQGEGRSPSFIEINPGGKVPALVDGDLTLTESAAICTYIGDRFPSSGLTPPPGTKQRALYDKWCFFVIGELEQPLWTLAKHRFVLPEKHRVPAVMDTALWEFSVALKVLDAQLGDRPYAVGDSFTAADLLIAHTLEWARAFKVPVASARLNQYADRILARSARERASKREAG